MKSGLVSIIISAYNAKNFIADAIGSILNQTYKEWEVILINDCSSDNTHRVVQRLFENIQRLKLIHNGEKLGPYPGANIGLKHAQGEFIARLDADDIAEPQRLEKQVNFLNTHPNVALVGSGAYLIDASGHKTGKIHAISRDIVIRKLLTRVNLFIHSSLLARRKAIEDVGGYRENFRYAADYDLFLRLSDKHIISNIPECLIRWRIIERGITIQHHILQRTYADIAREFAFERRKKGYDSYDHTDFPNKIRVMMEKNYGRYLCHRGVYKAFFSKQYREGLFNVLKGIRRGGIPYNSLMRAAVQIIARF